MVPFGDELAAARMPLAALTLLTFQGVVTDFARVAFGDGFVVRTRTHAMYSRIESSMNHGSVDDKPICDR